MTMTTKNPSQNYIELPKNAYNFLQKGSQSDTPMGEFRVDIQNRLKNRRKVREMDDAMTKAVSDQCKRVPDLFL